MAEKVKSFVLSDESLNTYGFRLLTSGGDLKQFKRNPVMFFNHDHYDTPIGIWENIRLEGDKILADPVFDLEDERGKMVASKVERGFLRMASAGLRVLQWSEDPKDLLPGQTKPTAIKWILREASVVGMGSNHNALRLYDEEDNVIPEDKIIELFYKPKHKKMDKKIMQLLDLPEDGNEEQLFDAVKALIENNVKTESELKALKDAQEQQAEELKEVRLSEARKLIDTAVKEGRLTADGKEKFLKFFEVDYDSALSALGSIPARQRVTEMIEKNSQQSSSELSDLSAKSWDELDRENKLQVLKDKYPDVYTEKFEQKYGKKPKTV